MLERVDSYHYRGVIRMLVDIDAVRASGRSDWGAVPPDFVYRFELNEPPLAEIAAWLTETNIPHHFESLGYNDYVEFKSEGHAALLKLRFG